ncbi:MAG: hypothetical protein FWE30_06360 [Bacteroidales bacterium]|nr:hypothetical protein [Bacteroidales bacterium]MCL2739052.1 hypothetical protein [Bacteroidales bacterium]
MKKLFFPIILFFLTEIHVHGQEPVTVKFGEDINQISVSGKYLFPEFQNARVFRQHESFEVQMNYNALTGEMEFIDPTGTILALGDVVQFIVFGKRIFKQTPKGYLEILADDSGVEFLVHRQYKVGDIKKHGAYGTTSSTTSITSYSAITADPNYFSLSLAQDAIYFKTDTYYIYAARRYRLANRSGFTRVFGRQRPGLKDYLKQEPVNFSNGEDLIRLFTYCSQ